VRSQVIEGQLGESILEKDGRLAFSNLAASTINTLLPKMETQGQLGKGRWRLVAAPSIPVRRSSKRTRRCVRTRSIAEGANARTSQMQNSCGPTALLKSRLLCRT
jgi:hypothetical protein